MPKDMRARGVWAEIGRVWRDACRQAGHCKGYAWGLALAAMIYLLMASALSLPLGAPTYYDSYSLQAMVWRSGHIVLPQNYEWLELATYQGGYYVSFPPFPTLVMLPLTFLFGQSVPSMLLNFLMFLGSYSVGYAIARKLGRSDVWAAAFAVFWVAGCNLLEVSLYGGVWNIAQGMSYLLTMLAVYGALHARGGWTYAGPVCLACAVGCRPFQAVYVPVILYALWSGCRQAGEPVGKALRHMAPKLVAPLVIALAYGVYNTIRFDNPLEFGHNYLPEYLRSEHGQFSAFYIGQNIANIFRMPYVEDAQLRFPNAFGFAFFLCNPLYILAGVRLIEAAVRRLRGARSAFGAMDALLCGCAALHFGLFLLHKGFGAWQFGTRYLIDLLPVLGWFALRRDKPIRFGEGLVMLWAVGFNIYGGLLFHLAL